MSEWKEAILEDITSHIGDGLHGTPTYDPDGEYFFINGNNLKDGKILVKEDTKRVSKEVADKHKKPLSDKSILLSINGTIGNLAYYKSEKCMLGKSACYVNIAEDVSVPFMYYHFMSEEFQFYIEMIATGTTIPNVPLKGIRKYPFKLPPLPTQRAIASVLASLDDKIGLLHRQNQTLEAMAQTLFRQWFIEEAAEDWEEVSLYNAIDLVGGGTPKTSIDEYWDGDINWLSGGDIASNHKNFVTSTERSITQVGLQNSSAKLLPKYSTVISARGTVGKYCLLSEEMAFSQSNYGIKPKFNECYFFTYLLIAHSVEWLKSAAYGSVFDTITTKTFKNHKVKIPSKDDITAFEKEISSYFQKMLSNQQQIEILEKLRDTLLPKLMSGQVRVRTEKSAEKYV